MAHRTQSGFHQTELRVGSVGSVNDAAIDFLLPAGPVAERFSLEGRPRRRRVERSGSGPVWLWAAILLPVLVAIPIAGATLRTPAPAAASTAASILEDEPLPTEWPMRVTVRVGHSERSGPVVELNDDSLALGTPNGGALEHGTRLPVDGEGYYTYDPSTQRAPQSPARRWGTSQLVSQIVSAGEWWARRHPGGARLGIGDLSLEHGGHFGGPGVGHASHQNGLDVDVRLPRRDGVEGPANPGTYDRALTQALVDRFVSQGASLVLIGPNLDLHGPAGVVVRWPNHDDHLHVRFPDPDGLGN